MKKYLFTAILALMAILNVTAENMQQVERKVKDFKPFERIEIKGSSEVVYTQGDKASITIKGPSDMVDLVTITTEDGKLTVSQNTESFSYNRQYSSFREFVGALLNGFKEEDFYPVVYVTSPDLIEVSLTGSGDFDIKGRLDTDNLKLTLKGSGDMDIEDIICDNIHVMLQGSGDIDIDNVEAINSNYELKGSGDIDVKQQRVHRTDINLYGSGDVKVVCTKCQQVNAKLTGSGDIDVYGDVEKTTQEVRGSGDIEFH